MAHRQPPLIIQTQFGNGSLSQHRGQRHHHGNSPPRSTRPRSKDHGLPHAPDAPPAVDFLGQHQLARRPRASSPTSYMTSSAPSSRYPSQRRVEFHDSRSENMNEKRARQLLTTYHVVRLEKQDTANEFDSLGNEVRQTWQAAVHHHLPAVSQQETAHAIRMLTQQEGNVMERKQKLLEPIQCQLEKAQESLEKRERDQRYHYILAQFEKKTYTFRRSEQDENRHDNDLEYSSGKHKDVSSKRKHKASKSFFEPSRSRSKSKSKQKIKHTISLTAYFMRTPRDNVSCLKMLQERDLADEEAIEDEEEEEGEEDEYEYEDEGSAMGMSPMQSYAPHAHDLGRQGAPMPAGQPAVMLPNPHHQQYGPQLGPQPGPQPGPPRHFGNPAPMHQGPQGPPAPLNGPPQGLGVHFSEVPPPPQGHHGVPAHQAHPPPPPPPPPPPGPGMPNSHQAHAMPGQTFGPPPPPGPGMPNSHQAHAMPGQTFGPPPPPLQPVGVGHITGHPPPPPTQHGVRVMPPNMNNAHRHEEQHVHVAEDLADSPQSNMTSLFDKESDDDISTSPSSTEFDMSRKKTHGQPQYRPKDFGIPERPIRKHTKPYIEDEDDHRRRPISPSSRRYSHGPAFITPSRGYPHSREDHNDTLPNRNRHDGVPMPRVVQAPRHFRPPSRARGSYESDLDETERRFGGLRVGGDRRDSRGHESRDRGGRGFSPADRSRDRSPDRGYRSDSFYRNSFDQRLPPRRAEPPKASARWSDPSRGYSSVGNHSASPRYRADSPRRQQYVRHRNDESSHRR